MKTTMVNNYNVQTEETAIELTRKLAHDFYEIVNDESISVVTSLTECDDVPAEDYMQLKRIAIQYDTELEMLETEYKNAFNE